METWKRGTRLNAVAAARAADEMSGDGSKMPRSTPSTSSAYGRLPAVSSAR